MYKLFVKPKHTTVKRDSKPFVSFRRDYIRFSKKLSDYLNILNIQDIYFQIFIDEDNGKILVKKCDKNNAGAIKLYYADVTTGISRRLHVQKRILPKEILFGRYNVEVEDIEPNRFEFKYKEV